MDTTKRQRTLDQDHREDDTGIKVNSRLFVRPKKYRRRVKKAQRTCSTESKEDSDKTITNAELVESDGKLIQHNDVTELLNEIEVHVQAGSWITEHDANSAVNENPVPVETESDTLIEGEGLNRSCDEALVDRLLHELGRESENETSDLEDHENDESDSNVEANILLSQPVSPGHKLTLKTSILVIWMFVITHCLTSSQFEDLLTLINLHLMVSHPVFKSVHRFKKALNRDFSASGLRKHYFCTNCNQPSNENNVVCSNELCRANLSNNNRAHFIELDVVSQLKNLFKRDDFVEGIKYPLKRKKKSQQNIEDVYDGEHYKNLFADIGNDPSVTNLSFVFNTDGVPIFKSSSTSVWPIFLMLNELPYKMRTNREFMILAGLWCGPTKPLMNLFLQPMMNSLNILKNGISIEGFHVKGFLHCMSCDLPAMSAVLNTMSHTGEFSCIKCYQPGSNHRTRKGGNVRIFQYDRENPAGPERQHQEIISDAELAVNDVKKHSNGIKGPSILMFCPRFDCVRSIAKDYMHMIHLGLNRMLMKLWFTSEYSQEPYSVHKDIKLVDDRLVRIKVPHFITRTPRSISEHLKFWKASEHRAWFFYYSIPCLKGILAVQYLYHYYALVQGIFLLNQSSISFEDIAKAEQLLQYFVFMLPSLYSEKCMTLNAHSLLHLPKIVKELGPLWSYSCFAFEGANGELLKMFHGTQFIDMQIVNAVNIYQLLPTLGKDVCSFDVAFKFVKSFTHGKGVQNEDSIVALGKPYKNDLDLLTRVKVQQYIRCEDVDANVQFYKRLKIHGSVFQSLAYTRVQKRNSFTVKFNLEGEICYGSVLWYGLFNENTTENLFACIEVFEPAILNIFSEGSSCDQNLIANNFMELDTNLFRFMKSSKRICIISALNIISMCICSNIDNTICLSEEPNNYEKNL